MNFKEHVQFLILMIPTLLLFIAAVVTLAAPARSTTGPHAAVDPLAHQEIAQLDTEFGPMRTVVVQ